jgi:hypothetical protein
VQSSLINGDAAGGGDLRIASASEAALGGGDIPKPSNAIIPMELNGLQMVPTDRPELRSANDPLRSAAWQ